MLKGLNLVPFVAVPALPVDVAVPALLPALHKKLDELEIIMSYTKRQITKIPVGAMK